MNKQEFNYETYLEGKHKLVTRGGIEVPRENLMKYNGISFVYCYLNPSDKIVYSTGKTGLFDHPNAGSAHDLLMIPIEPIQTDETIPFDLEKFKSGEYEIVYKHDGDIPVFAVWSEYKNMLVVIWEKEGSANFMEQEAKLYLLLRKKPISPFTHPHLYEVSDDEKNWSNILKYYDFIESDDFPHKTWVGNNKTLVFKHLRLKQPTEISKDQAFDALWNKLEVPMMQQVLTEKFGEFKIK